MASSWEASSFLGSFYCSVGPTTSSSTSESLSIVFCATSIFAPSAGVGLDEGTGGRVTQMPKIYDTGFSSSNIILRIGTTWETRHGRGQKEKRNLKGFIRDELAVAVDSLRNGNSRATVPLVMSAQSPVIPLFFPTAAVHLATIRPRKLNESAGSMKVKVDSFRQTTAWFQTPASMPEFTNLGQDCTCHYSVRFQIARSSTRPHSQTRMTHRHIS